MTMPPPAVELSVILVAVITKSFLVRTSWVVDTKSLILTFVAPHTQLMFILNTSPPPSFSKLLSLHITRSRDLNRSGHVLHLLIRAWHVTRLVALFITFGLVMLALLESVLPVGKSFELVSTATVVCWQGDSPWFLKHRSRKYFVVMSQLLRKWRKNK